MATRTQLDGIRRNLALGIYPTPTGRFTGEHHRVPRVECVVCGASGFGPLNPTAHDASPWQLPHMLDHPFICSCGKRYVGAQGLSRHLWSRDHAPDHRQVVL